MDPKATIALINDEATSRQDRIDAIDDLAQWIAKGGFPPFDSGFINEEHQGERYDKDLIAAINVVLANGDLSGLEGLGYEVKR